MKHLPVIFSLLALFALSSCGQKEEEPETDYDSMVMTDEEEWTTSPDDKKVIAQDAIPDPQELLILEVPEQKQ